MIDLEMPNNNYKMLAIAIAVLALPEMIRILGNLKIDYQFH